MPTQIIASDRRILRRWFTANNLFLLACLLCGLPVWLPHFPPMVDLPQHAAQVSLFLNLGKPDFPFSNEFQLNLFTPYLLGYTLIAALTPLLGIVAACKLVIWLALAAFALASRFLLLRTGADPYWAWLTFPVLYGFTYQWGLLNFLIAAPVGMLFLGLVWRQQVQPGLRSSLLIALMLYVLFFCHALIMALFVLIAVAYWLSSVRRMRDFVSCAWPIATLVPIVLVWLAVTSKHPLTNSAIEWDWSWVNTTDGYYAYFSSWINPKEPGWGRVTGFIPRLLGVRPGLPVTLAGLMLFALPFLAGGRIARSWPRFIPLLSIVLLLLLLPSFLFGNVYTFQRFTFLALPLFLVAIDAPAVPGRAQRNVRMIFPLIAFGWIAYMSSNALQFNQESDDFETVVAQMEPDKRAASLIFARDDSRSIVPVFLHFPAWYSAIKSGISNPSFAENFVQPVAYKPEYVPKVKFQGFAWNPQWFDWQAHEGYKYDYFVVRAPVDGGAFLFRTATCKIYLAARSGQWWLYRRDAGC
jgi:hypothetical protein